MVLRQRKAPERQGKVLVIDASRLFKPGRNQNTLESEHRKRVEHLYATFADEPGLAHVTSFDEIANNDFDLNISRYVAPPNEEQLPTLAEATADLKAALDEAYAAEDRLLQRLKAEGLILDEGTV
jgi:type I restriction enzyme M protein